MINNFKLSTIALIQNELPTQGERKEKENQITQDTIKQIAAKLHSNHK